MQVAPPAERDPVVVVCRRTRDLRFPHVSSIVESCAKCRASVWLALETLSNMRAAGLADDPRVLCVACGRPELADATAVVGPPGRAAAAVASVAEQLGARPGVPVIEVLDRRGRRG